jgi:hypothetical protein
MNLNSFIGYCGSVSFVMKDKLDQAMADERIITNQNADESELLQRQAQRPANNATPTFATPRVPLANSVPLPPINPQNTDILARMLDRASNTQQQAQQQGLLAQVRAMLANPASLTRLMNTMLAQAAGLFLGAKRLQETDQAAKDKRNKADEAAERENPGLLLLDVENSTNVNTGKQ